MKITKRDLPVLRFPEFKEEWKMKKLGEEISFLAGYAFESSKMSDKPSNFQLIKMSNVYQNELRLDRNPSYLNRLENEQQKFILERGDIVLTLTGTVGKRDYGYSIMIRESDKYVLNQRLVRLREKRGRTVNNFIHFLVTNQRFLYHFFSNSKGGTGNQSNVSIEDLKITSLNLPNIVEQEKIGGFLSSINDKIQHLQKKKSLLEEYKKGVMQQIFSQQIRFKDEDGKDYPEWEEKTLAQVGEIVGGGTPDTTNADYWGGNILWFTPTELKSKYVFKSNRTITESGLQKSSTKLLPAGTLLLTTRATIGDISIAKNECSTNQGFQSIVVNQNNWNEFIYYWILFNKKSFIKKASGSTFLEINKNEIQKIEITLPTLTEQKKISMYLSYIDNKIDIVQVQIEKSQNFKKGLLQQMFI